MSKACSLQVKTIIILNLIFVNKVNSLLNKTRSFWCLAAFWLTSIIISIPYSWMTVYNTNPDKCELNMSFGNLIYVIALNATIIFLPVVVLVTLHIAIIIKSWNNYRNHVQICSFSRINSYKEESNRGGR